MNGLWGVGGSLSALGALLVGAPIHVAIGIFVLCALQLCFAHLARMAQQHSEDLKVESDKEIMLAKVEVTKAVVSKLARVEGEWASEVLSTMTAPEQAPALEPKPRGNRRWRRFRRPDRAA